MAHYNTIFSQLLHLVPRHQFENSVSQFQGDRYTKSFTTWNQLTVLLYAFAGGKTSLRDIQLSLASQGRHFYHLGLPDTIARSTIADANSKRDHRIFEDLFYRLEARCRVLAPKHRLPFKNPFITLDSTVIELGISLYPWARHCKTQGALKLHYGYDNSGGLPNFVHATTRKGADNVVAREEFPVIPDSINCFDKGYLDLKWFRRIHEAGAFFVTRARQDMTYEAVEFLDTPDGTSVIYDVRGLLRAGKSRERFPYPIRFIGYKDPKTGKMFRFITNKMDLPAQTVADIYQARWQIEAFFKWIKQNLKIKSFLGTSRNAVLTQIWVAMCYYLILSFIKFQTRYGYSLHYLHRIVKATLLDRLTIVEVLSAQESHLPRIRDGDPQFQFALV